MLCFKFHKNCKTNEEIDFFEGGGGKGQIQKGLGRNFEKKMKTYKMPTQNKSMYEVSSKSDNGKGFKNRGKIRKRN